MAPRNFYEIVILRVSFDPLCNHHPDIQRTELEHIPELPDLRERSCLEQVVLRERDAMPANVKIRYTLWQVKTGDASLFKVGIHDFQNILIVLGEELCYYMYYICKSKNQTHISGFAETPLSYCGCCLDTHYMKIIEAVKNLALIFLNRENGGLNRNMEFT